MTEVRGHCFPLLVKVSLVLFNQNTISVITSECLHMHDGAELIEGLCDLGFEGVSAKRGTICASNFLII